MAELSEEQLRIRSYLQAQAAKLSVADLMGKVRADSEQLAAAALAASAVDANTRPAPGGWSVNEVLEHLRETSRRVNAGMLSAARGGAQPSGLADALSAATESRSPAAWVDVIRAEREVAFARLAPLNGDENLEIRWSHPFFGDLNWREWLLFLRLHDLDHANQVREIAIALGES